MLQKSLFFSTIPFLKQIYYYIIQWFKIVMTQVVEFCVLDICIKKNEKMKWLKMFILKNKRFSQWDRWSKFQHDKPDHCAFWSIWSTEAENLLIFLIYINFYFKNVAHILKSKHFTTIFESRSCSRYILLHNMSMFSQNVDCHIIKRYLSFGSQIVQWIMY